MTERADLKVVTLETGPDVVKSLRELLVQAERGEILGFVGCFEEKGSYQMVASTRGQKETIAMGSILFAWTIRKYGGGFS